ncbi:L-threonylcarbamoyladenylate synthase [Phosphitispora fastidiosa]|uniref:L-threonylcarbamoyladenylate synthase n=1 Tax=Phosphitispora fastidiosa TaxID=2837202 RepID=UPI001E2DD182
MQKKTETQKKTEILSSTDENLEKAAQLLRGGGLVAFPTETVYGLGANALDPAAVSGIFAAKGRPCDNPLIVHISDVSQVYDLSDDITVPARRVMEVFWPGPLTVVLPRKSGVPDVVTAGLDTVAVRMPDHPAALGLISKAGIPVAAPSANSSGSPSPTTAGHVAEDLSGKIDAVVDGGPCRVGVESTVIDMTLEPPVILRPGGVTREQLEAVLGPVETAASFAAGNAEAPKSPGMKYRHYSPKAEVVLVTGEQPDEITRKVSELTAKYRCRGKRIGVLASAETAAKYKADAVFDLGSRGCSEEIARNLFYGLRHMDMQGVDIIISEGYSETGIGAAVMNRLRKAAGSIITV